MLGQGAEGSRRVRLPLRYVGIGYLQPPDEAPMGFNGAYEHRGFGIGAVPDVERT